MRPSHIIILFCLLTTALCSTSPAAGSLPGRQVAMAGSSMSSSSQQDEHEKVKVQEETERDSNRPHSYSNDFARVYNEPKLVYHFDYHGVTTHPNPTPRHPKP